MKIISDFINVVKNGSVYKSMVHFMKYRPHKDLLLLFEMLIDRYATVNILRCLCYKHAAQGEGTERK
jgi:hypothetical protein